MKREGAKARLAMYGMAAALSLIVLCVFLAMKHQYVPGSLEYRGTPARPPVWWGFVVVILPFWILAFWVTRKGGPK